MEVFSRSATFEIFSRFSSFFHMIHAKFYFMPSSRQGLTIVILCCMVSQNVFDNVCSVLNRTARLIHLSSRCEHATPLLIQLHWLPIEQRITFKIVVIYIQGSSWFCTWLYNWAHKTLYTLRSLNKLLLFKPRFNLMTYGSRSLTMAAPICLEYSFVGTQILLSPFFF